MFASAALALSLAALASAQTTHTVTVGQGGLVYTPDTVVAALGDIVQFQFVANNHTATVSSFANPCTAAGGSFTSGFQPVTAGTTNFPEVSYNVQTTDPVWFYCGQKVPVNHCESGMVFAINPPTNGTNTFANFQANAKALANATSSGSSTSAGSSTSSAAASSSSVSIPADVTESLATATFEWQGAPYTTTYSSYPGSPAPTAGVAPTVFNVTVGFNATLTYNPSVVNANIGDIVQFIFPGGNHTATQTSFNFPCVPETNSDGTRVFDTGYEPVGAGVAPVMVNFTVETENPQWFGCMQKKPVFHCGAGMNFAINPPASGDHSFAAFQALAISENGTTTTPTSASPSSGPSQTAAGNGAAGLKVGAGALFTVVAGVFAFLL
ncbi:hypothetical protein CALVIDRAFT_567386 [Calocera viscosa TUFC12733]|uniref:Cupredoxin n=1 Tax=Calocera viscosa (strain TUFC12733) TaxID=1330018 RepID=A0A167I5W9_CALVF|nr:hypothetical protein CALVIDRAFT_567386 [Calocera viscosa TUFC12733]